MNQSRAFLRIILLILSIGLVFGLVWGNYRFAEKNISGEGFSIQWIGIHALVKNGDSPYSDKVTRQIQGGIKSENNFEQGKNLRYSSPLYSGIIVLPAAFIENTTLARTFWLTVQLIALFAIFLMGLKLVEWKPAWYIFFLFTIITFFSYHTLLPWLDGGLSIWSAFFIGLAFLSMRNHWNEMGGIFLALSAIQPQMSILMILYVLIWAAMQRRRILILWFFMALIVLSILGLFLVPDWIMQYIRIIYNYRENFPPGNPGALFRELWPGVGKQLGWFITIISGLLLIFEGWLSLRRDFRHFLWTACLILVLSQWVGLPTTPGNLVGLILPLFLIGASLAERWPRGGQWAAVVIALILFVWEWVLLYFDVKGTGPGMQLNLIIPLPLICVIGLYWVRWWAIRPKRMLLEELRFSEGY